MWLQDYTKRFYLAPKEDQDLSPLWDEDAVSSTLGGDPKYSERKLWEMAQYKINFDFSDTPPNSAVDNQSLGSGLNRGNPTVEYANAQTGLKWQSCKLPEEA